mgnify:CR=1 FL=1
MTSSFLFSCFSICSKVRSSPELTMVMQDTAWSSVSPTARLSILKHLRENRPATLHRTPERFSTSTEYIPVSYTHLTLPTIRDRNIFFSFTSIPLRYFTRSMGSIRHSNSIVLSSAKNASSTSSACSIVFRRR